MLGAQKKRLDFVKELKEGMLDAFPDFQQNPYYQQFTNAEEKEMIALQMKSDKKFFRYYRLKVWVRKMRKKLHV